MNEAGGSIPWRLFAQLPLLLTGCVAPEGAPEAQEAQEMAPVAAQYAHHLLPPVLTGEAPPIHDDFLLTIDAERVALTRDYLEFHNTPVFESLPEADEMESIRFDPRVVVVHYTVTPTLAQTVALFDRLRISAARGTVAANGDLNVGIQFMIDRDGGIYRSYPEDVMSRHVIGLNHTAIGIENIGNADYGEDGEDLLPMTPAQLEANVSLIRYLAGKYPTLEFMIGHSEYRSFEDPAHPGHELFHETLYDYRTVKTDPGERFLEAIRARLGGGSK